MRRSPLSLYGPFLVIALVQALVIAVAPSTVPPRPEVAALPDPGQTPAPGTSVPAPGDPAPTATTPTTDPATDPSTTTAPPTFAPGGTSADPGGDPGGEQPQPPATSEPGGTRTPAGDTSHCTEDGRQHGITYNAPPCRPVWTGTDNGGATYAGVTADTIRVAVFRENRNPVVTEILEKEDLRATREQEAAFMEAAQDVLNANYEFHGRELDLIYHYAPTCPETPPEVPPCRAEAQRAIQEVDPFAVIWDVPTYSTVYDEWVKEDRLALGGWHHDNTYFAGRRPYRWDVFMDGTRTADLLAEYYCKKLSGHNATHSGRIIHPTIGARGEVPRRLGIVVPDTEATMLPAQRVVELVKACPSPDPQEPLVFGYDQDIERSTQQAQPTTQSMIDNAITTVVCLCDPIAPAFRTQNQTRNNYFPEFLMAGSGLLDHDKLGRLYDQQQMAHAFGPSHLALPFAHSDSNASRVWRAAGNQGDACGSCNLLWSYYELIGWMIQEAGPDLSPLTVEQAMLAGADRGGWAESGGDPHYPLIRFGQGDHTGISDLREVYWDASAPSPIDGRPGTYVPLQGGRRYAPGELGTSFDVPVSAR